MVDFLIAAALAAACLPAAPAPVAPAPTPARPCSWSATPTPPSTSSAPSMRSTASPTGSTSQVRDAFEQSDELVLETLVPEGPARPARQTAAALPRPIGDALGFVPCHHPHGDQRRPVAGHAGRQWRRHGAAPHRRGRRQAGRGPRDARIPARHVHQDAAAPTASPRPRRADASRDQPMDSLSKAMAEMQAAWKRGDQSVFVRMLGQLSAASPDTYRMMFTERNARWADWIAARHADARARCSSRSAPAISPGKDSVLVQLAERGIPSHAGQLTGPKLAFPSARPLGRALPGHGHPWRRGGAILQSENSEMSEQLTLPAEARDRAGKGASRALRRDGRVPAVVYGEKKEPLSIHVEEKLLDQDAFDRPLHELGRDDRLRGQAAPHAAEGRRFPPGHRAGRSMSISCASASTPRSRRGPGALRQ